MEEKQNSTNMQEKTDRFTKDKGDDTMAASARNYVYEIKVSPTKEVEEPKVTKEFLEMCKKVAQKYPEKNGFRKQR